MNRIIENLIFEFIEIAQTSRDEIECDILSAPHEPNPLSADKSAVYVF
jgi:hypothetical protein